MPTSKANRHAQSKDPYSLTRAEGVPIPSPAPDVIPDYKADHSQYKACHSRIQSLSFPIQSLSFRTGL